LNVKVLRYIELKSGHSDNGPAWIAYVRQSGHLQAWMHVSSTPLPADSATAIGKRLALTYGGDRASTDWRHLGRLYGCSSLPQAFNVGICYAFVSMAAS
jgi:hypothetical protein